jgi:hypothetical protein
MNVFVPHVGAEPEVVLDALRADDIEPAPITMSLDTDYYGLLSGLWAEGRTFVIVEHDIIVWPGAVRALLACEEPWCAYPYKIGGHYSPGFGCVKFEGEFTYAHRNAIEMVGDPTCPYFSSQGNPRHWSGLDSRLGLVLSVLSGRGWPHLHQPAVTHLNRIHWQPGTPMPDTYRGAP